MIFDLRENFEVLLAWKLGQNLKFNTINNKKNYDAIK